MTPKYAQGDECSIKFGVSFALRDRFAAACAKIGMTQAGVLRAMVEAWTEEVDEEPPQ